MEFGDVQKIKCGKLYWWLVHAWVGNIENVGKSEKTVKKSEAKSKNFPVLFLAFFLHVLFQGTFCNRILGAFFYIYFHNLINPGFHGFCLRETDLTLVLCCMDVGGRCPWSRRRRTISCHLFH